jgi:hypothetical protein
MAKDYGKPKKRPVGKMILYGAASVSIYVLALTYQNLITAYFTRGALYAILPIAGAFTLSYVHGHFTGYFWSVLGIEAKRKSVSPKREAERTELRERPQPQPRMRAGL